MKIENKFWFKWGNEKFGNVHTYELINGEIFNMQEEPLEVVWEQQLQENCPFH